MRLLSGCGKQFVKGLSAQRSKESFPVMPGSELATKFTRLALAIRDLGNTKDIQ